MQICSSKKYIWAIRLSVDNLGNWEGEKVWRREESWCAQFEKSRLRNIKPFEEAIGQIDEKIWRRAENGKWSKTFKNIRTCPEWSK